MRRFLILAFAILAVSARLPAQTGAVGNLTASSTDCLTTNSCLEVDIPQGMGSATIKASGTMNVVFQFEASADPLTVPLASAHWVAFSMNPSDGTSAATSATESGSNLSLAWQQNIGAYKRIRLRVSTYTSGTLAGAINLSTVAARSGGNGNGGGGTPSLPFNSVQFNNSGSFGGSANLTYANTGGSCGLTAVATLTQCGDGAGSFNSQTALNENIVHGNGAQWNQVYSNSDGTGNTGTTRATFLSMQMGNATFNDEFNMEMTTNGHVDAGIEFGGSRVGRPSGVSGGLNFDGNGDVEIGVDNSDSTQTEWKVIPNGDMQLVTETGKALCIQGTSSGQGCLSVDATSTTMTETLPFQVTSDGVHPGALSLICNTTNPSLASNSVTIFGCPAATNTAWSLQLPTAIPTTTHLFSCVVTSTNCLLTDSGLTGSSGNFGATSLTCGVLNSTSCVITGYGSTSGTATMTWPAVAGTSNNPIVFSNTIQIPAGGNSTPGIGFAAGRGLYESGSSTALSGDANGIAFFVNTTQYWFMGGAELQPLNSASIGDGTHLVSGMFSNAFSFAHLINSNTAPTIATNGCGGTNSTITAANGTASFEILIGSGGATAAGCTVTMPAATTSWTCSANTVSATSTSNALAKQTGAISTTSVVIQNFSDVSVATAFATSDTIRVMCAAN